MNARTRKHTPQQPSAAEAYAARRNDIARLMDVLQMELGKHHEQAKADPRNWGLPGDLGKVREDLINLVGFVSGMDPEQVIEFLNDAE